MLKVNLKKANKYISTLAILTLLASCSDDDDTVIPNDDDDIEIVDPTEEDPTEGDTPIEGDDTPAIADLEMVFNRFLLEDRTEGGDTASESISGIDNSYAQMLREEEDGRHYIGLTNFANVEEPIDRNFPNIEASRFAVFLTIAGAGLGTQNGFDAGDLPIYIGELETNGESVIRLIPAEGNGGTITIGGIDVNTRATEDITLTSTGDIMPQRSTGSRNSWYDWVVLHPFQGDALRPITYPGIVADLDADRQLSQNFEMIFNEFTLEDRTEGDGTVSASGIDNGTASIVSYDGGTFIRLSDFNNIDDAIDRNYPNIVSPQYAVFLTTAGAGLGAQNAFDTGDLPVYIGTLSANGFQDIELTPSINNENGSVTLGANQITINTNPNIEVDADGFITEQTSTGSRAILYDWIVLHPFEGENLRPITYPGIVADLDGANELPQNM